MSEIARVSEPGIQQVARPVELGFLSQQSLDEDVRLVHADGTATKVYRRQRRSAYAGEGVKHGLTMKAEQLDDAPRNLGREDGGM